MYNRIIVFIGLLFFGLGDISNAQPMPLELFSQTEKSIKTLESFELEKRGVILNTRLNSGEPLPLRIEVLTDYIVRVRASLDGKFEITLPEKDGFIKSDWPETDFKLIEEKEFLKIDAKGVTVRIDRDPFRLSFYTGNNLLTWGFPHEGIRFGDKQVLLTMSSPPDEHYFGFGDQGEGWKPLFPPDRAPLEHRGQSMLMAGLSCNRLYYTPFFMSSRGYGVFINALVKSFWDMAKTYNDRYSIMIDEPRLDLYLIAGPLFCNILKRYTELAGRPPLLPKWELGGRAGAKQFGIEVDGEIPSKGWNVRWFNQKEIEDTARRIRAQHIPCDYFLLGSAWQTIRNSFDWVSEIPDPEGMMEILNRLNFKVELWQRATPAKGDYSLYREAEQKGYLVKGPDGKPFICQKKYGGPSSMVDFTNQKAVKWWQEKVKRLIALGVSAFFLDSASSSFLESYPEALELMFHNGMTGKELDNYYGPLYLKTVWDALKNALNGRRAVVSCRHQAYFAAGRFPYMDLGDRGHQGFREYLIRSALNNGLSGVPFWNSGGFGSFGLPLVDIELKIQLIPYTYTYWHLAHKTGLPVMRAMMLEFQDNPESYKIDTQFLYGREFLVAPVLNEVENWRKVYIPKGEWINYWTKEKYLGPGWEYIRGSQGMEPIFVRGGAIIPMGPMMEYAGEKQNNPITLDIYPYRESSFTLYEDDGETYEYESGRSAITQLVCKEGENSIEVEIGPTKGEYRGKPGSRVYILKVNGTTRPDKVILNGQELSEIDDEQGLEKMNKGWLYQMQNGYDRTVFIKLPSFKANQRIQVRLEKAVPIRYYRT